MSYIDNIPESTLETIQLYVDHHIPTGSFMYAVLTNDLFGAFDRADPENRQAMGDIVMYLHNEVRGDCFGDKETVAEWLNWSK